MITPQIDNQMQTITKIIEVPSKTYKFTPDSIGGFVDGKQSVEQAIYHILMIERYSCLIYGDDYGVELEQYIGNDISYLEATIEDTLKEALTQDNRILDVVVTNIDKTQIENVKVDFIVTSTYGDIEMEVDISV